MMENNNDSAKLMKHDGKEHGGADNSERSYAFFSQKEETIFPLCESYFQLDTICSSLPQETSLDLSQRRGSKITECNVPREVVAGLPTVENVSASSDISASSVNITSDPSPINSGITSFQEGRSTVCDIMKSLPLTLHSVLGSPIITKRGPGRPRKDRSGPVQRKKIFPGRPRVKTRKGSHTAIIPLQTNQLGVHETKLDYHHSDSALNDTKGFDIFSSAEETLFATELSRSNSLETGELDDSQMPFSIIKQLMPEENSHEQWPGKVCAFCNLGENSSLGQGELSRFDPSPGFNPFERAIVSHHESSEGENGSSQVEKLPKVLPLRRQKTSKLGRERGKMHRRSSLFGSLESVSLQLGPMDELEMIGFAEEPDPTIIFDPTGHIYCHHRCALWSEDICRSEEHELTNVDKAVCHGITQKCSNCRRYGATVRCRAMKCNRIYHFPCIASCGAFQDMNSLTSLCPQHISQAPILYGPEANCVMCDMPGVLTNLLFCISCGHHYHNSCLDPAIEVKPIVRVGWQCPDCKICQICRRPPEDDNKMLVCDTCDKGYHTCCLKPTMVTIPKNGWKCKNCRKCGDCGARTPGSGPSSRWHMNYTVCDSCYQQRNKGVACPLCGKAYRQFSQRGEMAQCRVCRKFIHAECDSRIDQIKDGSSMPPYVCPVCSSPSQIHTPTKELENCIRTKLREEENSPHLEHPMSGIKDPFTVNNDDSLSSIDMELNLSEKSILSIGQPLPVMSLNADISQHYDPTMLSYFPRHLPIGGKFPGKKRIGVGRPRGSGKFAGKRRAKLVEFHRKRGPKPKVKIMSIPGVNPFSGLSIIETKDSKQDDEPTVDNKMLLCSATDEFVLTQDLCVMCGSFGRDEEGRVIACSQCGQCYHPYCVSVKLTAVILKKGWRCLDCTVCEGCGKPHDEGRLLLCDDCDISYHTYCLDPPLDDVPQGNWKCKWCVICVQCGEKSPGYGSEWQNNYTMCGPCSSEICCPVCHMNYQESDLVIQCIQCERWLHGNCDQMTNEDDAEICSECGYHCILCRSKDEMPPHLMPAASPTPSLPQEAQNTSPLHKVSKEPDLPVKPKPQAQFYIDGVFLSESGMHQIKSLTIEQPKKPRARRQKQPPLVSITAIKSSIDVKQDDTEEVLPMETGNECEAKLEIDDINHEELVKPDIHDLVCEKKKRQRKLHKLGIGGFLARPRGRNVSSKDQCGELGSTVISLSASEQVSEAQGQLYSDGVFGSCGEGLSEYQLQEKPKRKRRVRKKNPLEDSYPSYLQEAFFGRDLLDTTKAFELNAEINSEDENPVQAACPTGSHEKSTGSAGRITVEDHTSLIKHQTQSVVASSHSQATPVIVKSSCQNDAVATTVISNMDIKKNDKIKEPVDEKEEKQLKIKVTETEAKCPQKPGEEEDLKDFLPLPQDLGQDDELMDILMNEEEDLTKEQALGISAVPLSGEKENHEENEISNNKEDPLAENIDSVLLSPHLNLDSMIGDSGLPQMDSKDVEDIIKGVLSPAEQSDHNSNSVLTPPNDAAQTSLPVQHATSPQVQPSRPSSRLAQQPAPSTPGSSQASIDSPFSLPPPSPFHNDYGSPQLPEPKSPWLENEPDAQSHGQKNILKWETDEVLGENATISPVLYANINHPNLKSEFPSWSDRAKQIAKIWRSLPTEKRQPYLQKARENRAASRMQKAQVEAGKVVRDQRSQREIDQERQWKQFQAIRQHQIQKQQQILQEQRAQAMLKAQQLALERIEGSPSDTSLSLSTSLPISSTVSPNAVVSPRAAESSPPISSAVVPGSLNELAHSQQVSTPSSLSRSPSDNGSPALAQCSVNPQQQQQTPHHIPAQINLSPTQCSIPSPSQSLQQSSCLTRRTSTPVIQVSRVRPPIDPSQLPGSDSFPQSSDSPLLSPAGTDSFVSPHRTLFVRQPVPQVRPVFSPLSNNQQAPLSRSEISRPSTPTVVTDIFQTPPSTPHAQNNESYSQHSPTTLSQLHSKENYSQPPPAPHSSSGPYSPSQSTCLSSVTHSPAEPYAHSPGTPRSNSAVSEHFVSPSGTPTSRFSQDSPFSPHLQRSQSVPASPTADPFIQQSSPCATSNLLQQSDVYSKTSVTSRPVIASTNRIAISRQMSETINIGQQDQPPVGPTTVHSLESDQVMARQQLRDLLQRQQMKKQDQGHGVVLNWQPEQQRSESCGGTSQSNSGFSLGNTIVQNATQEPLRPQIVENLHRPGGSSLLTQNSGREDGFRHPYPPALRSRMPLSSSELPFRHPSQVIEQRLASLRGTPQEARLRMLMLQQQQHLQIRGQQWPTPQTRMPGPRMSTGITNTQDQYDQINQQRGQPLQQSTPPLEIERIARFGQPAVCSAPTISNNSLSVHSSSHLTRTLVSQPTTTVTSNHQAQTFSMGTSAPLANACVTIAETMLCQSVTTTTSAQEQPAITVNSSTTTSTVSQTVNTSSVKHTHPVICSASQSLPLNTTDEPETPTRLQSAETENNEKQTPVVKDSNKLEATDSSSIDQLGRRKTTAGDLVKEVEEQAAEQETVPVGEGEDDELDDDELLGLGNDFNILEYADPELDKCLVGEGEKSNILDEHLDLDDKDDEIDSEVEEMKSRTGERKELSVEVKQESTVVADDKKKTTRNDGDKESPKSELKSGDFQTKFLEFSQRDVDKKDEASIEKKSDLIINIKKEDGDSNSMSKLTATSSPNSLTSDAVSCQKISSTFPNVQTNSPSAKVLPFPSEQSTNVHVPQPQGNIRPKSAVVTPSSPVNFGHSQTPLLHEQESHSPSQTPAQTPFVEQLRTSQPPPYPVGVPPPPPYQTHTVRPQSISTQQQALVAQRNSITHQNISRPNLPSGQIILSPNGQERSLLQEQPLLLEDLVEQEKREQRRQNQEGILSPHGDALLSDIEFERLKADVFSGPQDDTLVGPGSILTSQSSQSVSTNVIGVPSQRFPRPVPTLSSSGQQHSQAAWQGQHAAILNSGAARALHQIQVRSAMVSSPVGTLGVHSATMLHGEPPVRANLTRAIAPTVPGASGNSIVVPRPSFTVACLQPPPTPPSDPVTEQDRQLQVHYEQWLVQQQAMLTSHQKFLETDVGKLRKAKKALNTKQRQLRKNGQELPDHDASELARISQEQSSLQKQLDQVRKQTRQHSIAMQEYRMKQQKRQQQVPTGSPGQVHPVIVGMQTSPLGASLSPHRAGSGTPQSPMMSPSPIGPSPSPRMQHSPSPLMQNSPATLPPSPLMQQQSPLSQSSLLSQPGSHPSPGDPGQRPHQVHVLQDENNPFSESFQQREQLEKLQDVNEKCQTSSQLTFFGDETIPFSQNAVRMPSQPMSQVAIMRNDQSLLHHANSALAVSQLKARQSVPSDVIGQPFSSLSVSAHLQTAAHHTIAGTSVRPPPPYPHHLRPSPSPTSVHLTSLLKTESNTSCSQNQSHFITATHSPYKAPPPNITPYAEMLQQESPSQIPLSVNRMPNCDPTMTITSNLSPTTDHPQTPTKSTYSSQDSLQIVHSQMSNQLETDQVVSHSQLPISKEQTICISNRTEYNHERSSLNLQGNGKAFVPSSQCLNSHSTLHEKDLQSEPAQCKILDTSRNRNILANSPDNSVSPSVPSCNLTVAANVHCSYIQEKLTCNTPDVLNGTNNWAVNNKSSNDNISAEISAKCLIKDSNKSIHEPSHCTQNIDEELDNPGELGKSCKIGEEANSLLPETEKLVTSNTHISSLMNNLVKEEYPSDKEWNNCCKEMSKGSLSADSSVTNEKQNLVHASVKMEDYTSTSEQHIQEKSLPSASPVLSVIKDEPVHTQGAIDSHESVSSPKMSSDSDPSRCAISHTLSQSLPSSVTNTLNFTLRQTGMPTVCLPHNDETQLSATEKPQSSSHLSVELPDDKSQSSSFPDSSSATKQSTVKDEAAQEKEMPDTGVSLPSTMAEEVDSIAKLSPDLQTENTPNIINHLLLSSPVPTDSEKICIKVEPRDVEGHMPEMKTTEIKKEIVERPSCQMSTSQGDGTTLKFDEEIITDGSLNNIRNKLATANKEVFQYPEPQSNQKSEQKIDSFSMRNGMEVPKYNSHPSSLSNSSVIKPEQNACIREDCESINNREHIKIMGGVDGKELCQDTADGINQNVLLKQLLQNCPSAETHRKTDHFEEFVSIDKNRNPLKDPGMHDDVEKFDDSRVKKPSYLDIRRAQLEKEPTPPPEEINKPKRKRTKKKKMEGKEIALSKKRARKGSSSKAEEDYETFIEAMMTQLRSLPPIRILEPNIKPNFSVCPIFGSGDLNIKETPLRGSYGNACLPTQGDYYSTYPYGNNPPTPPASLPPTPPPFRYYPQELPHRTRERNRIDVPASLPTPPPYLDSQRTLRDADSPDTIISSSSPECVFSDSFLKWPGLRLIDEEDGSNDERKISSPVVPVIAPIPIRVFPLCEAPLTPTTDYDDEKDKENVEAPDKKSDLLPFKVKMVGLGGHPAPLKDSGNVAVTLTLSSAAAEDIQGVLSALANLLKIPAPTSYEIVERTATPPSQKLGLYKKSKDADVNIQTLLNGKPRFCRHCDIVVLTSGIRKKASDLLISSREEMEEDEVIFCSTNCYMQFALTHRSTTTTSEKEAAAVVSHLSAVTAKSQSKSEEDKDKPSKKIVQSSVNTRLLSQESLDEKICKNLPLEGTVFRKEQQVSSRTVVKQLTEKPGKLTDSIVSLPSSEYTFEDEQHMLQESTSDDEQSASRIAVSNQEEQEPPTKKWKGTKWKLWTISSLSSPKYRGSSEEEMGQMLDRLNISIKPEIIPNDNRRCVLCHEIGDGETNGSARILNMDVDKWIHLNCALWSAEVYETVNGALINVDSACKRALTLVCCRCHKTGASLKCLKVRCSNTYHFPCAMRDRCAFLKDKTMLCPQHLSRITNPDSELESVAVYRRVYVNRDEHKQVASMIHQGDQHLIRIGSLIFLNIGQLLPHQMPAFHTSNCIYPVGYKVIRMYWSMRSLLKRCQYICSICEVDGKPQFSIQVREKGHEDILINDVTAKGVWQKVLEPIEQLRRQAETIKVFPNFISGEDLFGLNEPAILRILESLPGVDTLSDYNFRYGRSPFLELPLAINPTGCARAEPKLRTHFKRPHTLHTSNTSRSSLQSSLGGVEVTSPYIKQFVHSKSSQYRKMKTEWRNNVYLARSHIQGLGLYAARDIEKHTMVIEYIGQLIRNEIAERNEAIYEAQNRGVYMFRLDENRVIDATLCGGLARYMNHSCNPNCVAEVVQIDRENKILIIANRRITRGEELTYDYKFEVEDDQHKIPCLCGAPNCRKWMN